MPLYHIQVFNLIWALKTILQTSFCVLSQSLLEDVTGCQGPWGITSDVSSWVPSLLVQGLLHIFFTLCTDVICTLRVLSRQFLMVIILNSFLPTQFKGTMV